ncbi:hypothetical protein [Nissabacter sp. SGAir0207]|uniref:hypothetical protein n=1 Tax=Nissabacter sp. SGAir0207 TaxID=2126321 RepID=UPI00143DBBA7|nr:hypothetical protein [Nissabacter sp. SGAir0207]
MFFTNPKLRKEIKVECDNTTFHLFYREQGCRLSVEKDDLHEVTRLINCLSDRDAALADISPAIVNIDVEEIISTLDKLGLLEEGSESLPAPSGVLSGEDFYYSRLLPTATKWQSTFGTSPSMNVWSRVPLPRVKLLALPSSTITWSKCLPPSSPHP